MLAGHVAELSDWGVSSLKIEGRMKRPEYAAIVTKVYSDLLREHRRPTAEERDILRRVFSRDGFTDGYYTGKLGDGMFGTKTDVPMNEVKKLYDEAAHRFAEGKEARSCRFRSALPPAMTPARCSVRTAFRSSCRWSRRRTARTHRR
ncbi:MAG: U32 family peptidase [Butyricicoccus sp.]